MNCASARKRRSTNSALYEDKIKRMGNAGRNGGECYTPRPLIRAMVQVVKPKVGERIYDGACGSAGFRESFDFLKSQKNLTTRDLKIAPGAHVLRQGKEVARRLDRADRKMQASQHRCFDRAIDAGGRLPRHHAEHPVDGLAGVVRQPRGEVLPLKVIEGPLQRPQVRTRERRVALFCDHRSRKIGRSPLRVARIAEPLLIKAVVVGLISPPGSANAKASVFIPATIA